MVVRIPKRILLYWLEIFELQLVDAQISKPCEEGYEYGVWMNFSVSYWFFRGRLCKNGSTLKDELKKEVDY